MAEQPYDPYVDGMVFKPAADITAYELACILQEVSSTIDIIPPRQIAEWPYGLCRHWQLIKS